MDLTTEKGSNIYGGSFNGPPASSFFAGNQTRAIQALIGSITLQNQTSSANTSTPTNTSSPTNTPTLTTDPIASAAPLSQGKTSHIGPIVGGTLGGVVLVCGVIISVLLWRHRRPRRQISIGALLGTPAGVAPAITPFNAQLRSPPATSSHTRKFGQSPASAQESGYGPSFTPTTSELPTEELVNLLYQRMQRPPEYPVTVTRR